MQMNYFLVTDAMPITPCGQSATANFSLYWLWYLIHRVGILWIQYISEKLLAFEVFSFHCIVLTKGCTKWVGDIVSMGRVVVREVCISVLAHEEVGDHEQQSPEAGHNAAWNLYD